MIFSAFAAIAALALAPQAHAGGGGTPKVVAGSAHTCALSDRGGVWCWGDNAMGQLGTGDTAPQAAPVPVPGLTEIKSVAAYGQGTCAVKHDGTVWCWGANDLGQLGQGGQDADPHPVPVQVVGVKDTYWVTGGSAHLCSVNWNGEVSCWGSNSDGQLANGGVGGFNGTATPIVGVSSIHFLSAGANFTCISTKYKKVRCAGANGAGQLGDVAFGANSGALVEVPGQEGIYEVRSGSTFVCGLSWSAEGHRCWGDNALGQLGQGVLAAPLGGTDAPAAPTLSIKHLGGSAGATCAHLKSRRVACWGDGTGGALGLGGETSTDTPTALALEDVGAVSSSSTSRTQCAIVRGGGLYCWGLNDFGQAGTGAAGAPVLTPAAIAGLDLVTRPQYPEGAWIEPTSQIRRSKSRKNWVFKSKLTVEPSDFVFPEQACQGKVAADAYFWRKVKKRAIKKSGGDDGYEKRKVGVRTVAKLRLSGGQCKAYFVQKVPIARFAKHKKRLRISATGFGNDVQSKFTTGEFELKNINRGKK